jgi:chromosome segregation ATPase
MIEPIMFIAIGFLVAGLLVIGFIPMVHARAVRLTRRRLEAMTPMSMAEIHADKDQLRAEFAMSTRRLEMSVEQMKAKTSSQLAEIGKKSEAIGRLKIELGEKAAALLGVEAKLNATAEEVQTARNELAVKSETLRETERMLAVRAAELAKFNSQLDQSSLTADSRRVELVVLQAQAEVLKDQIESYEKETRSLQSHLDAQAEKLETANALLAEERIKSDTFGARIKELDSQLTVQTTEAESLGKRVQELLAQLDQYERLAVEHEHTAERFRNQAEAAQRTEADVRAALTAREAERERLQQEIATLKREAENAGAERMETAVMRERIHDVAAEVAGLTAALEGPGSPIEAILASDAERPLASANGATGENGGAEKHIGAIATNGGSGSPKSSLADRIRALQNRRTRVPRAS